MFTENSRQNSDTRATRPRGRPFPQGVSGNPGGRPKQIEELRAVLPEVMTTDDKRAVVRKLIDLAKNGNLKAIALLIDNHDGKLPQAGVGGIDDRGDERPMPLVIIRPCGCDDQTAKRSP